MSPAGSSTGRSANRSNSAAVIMGDSVALRLCVKVLRFLAVTRTADRDEADRFFMAICHRGSPQGLRDLTNQEKARLVRRPSREPGGVRVGLIGDERGIGATGEVAATPSARTDRSARR